MSDRRLLLVAQSPVLRYGIRTILDELVPIDNVTEAGDALEAGTVAAAVDPHLIVIQYALPGVNGALAARLLRERCPDARIAILSDYTAERDVLRALQNGADALLPAAIEPASFVATVRDLLAGRSTLRDHVLEQPALAARVIAAVREAGSATDALEPAPRPGPTSLTATEIALLDGIVRDLPQGEVAQQLGASEAALRAASASLLAKLDAVDRTTVVISAVRHGLVHLDDHLPQQPVPGAADASVASAA